MQYVEDTFDTLVENAISSRTNFAYEGHFTNEATWEIPRRFKATGYAIHLIYFGLSENLKAILKKVIRKEQT